MQPLPPPGSAPAPPPPPLFLFMAFHNVHSPMQAPSWLIDQQNQSLCETRRTLHAMVAAVDNVTTVIIDKLKEHNMHVTLTTPSPSASSNFVLFWFCLFFLKVSLCGNSRTADGLVLLVLHRRDERHHPNSPLSSSRSCSTFIRCMLTCAITITPHIAFL